MTPKTSGPGDGELAARAAKDDQAAFQAIYEKCNRAVWLVCAKMLRNAADREEACQETWLRFLKWIREEPDPRRVTNVCGFLARMAYNVCIDILRRGARAGEAGGLDDAFVNRFLFSSDSPINAALLREWRNCLQDEDRTVFDWLVEGFTPAEIAYLMGVSQATAYRIGYRIRVRLEQQFGAHGGLLQ